MFGTDSERTLLSLGPDVAVIFVIKNATLGLSGCRSKMKKTGKNILNVICVALLASYLNCALIVRVTE